MKSYTSGEITRIVKEISGENTKIQDKISELRKSRKAIKLLDFKSKSIIDQKIEELTIQSNCYNYSILMLQLYEDSLRPNSGSMVDEELIQCEKKAEAGDGLSKLIVFCHKCFIDHTIIERDIKRLELESAEGTLSSSYILFGYNTFFAD